MAKYPRSIAVGLPPYQVTYHLQRNQTLLTFDEDVADERIDEILKAEGLEERSASVPRNVDSLRAARMRWVAVPGRDDSFQDIAEKLREAHGVSVMALPVYFEDGQGAESAAVPMPDALVIRLREGAEKESMRRLTKEFKLIHNGALSEHLAPFHYFKIHPDREGPEGQPETSFDLIDRIAEIEFVELVEFDWLKLETYLLTPNDPLWGNQWDMARIGLVGAWDVQIGLDTVAVAIIDSGFDLGHPDLAYTPANTHFNADQAIAGNPPPYDAGPSGVPHGTAVAGLAGAVLENSTGIAGVAGGCQIMPVRLGTVPTAVRVAAGINWAAANGARVGNLSLSTTPTAAAITAVVNAWGAGMVICAATGNSGGDATSPPVGFPANHANAIAVGASDRSDQRKRPASTDGECWGSQFGPETDVVAPGVQCWSTDEQGANGYNINGGPVTWACVNYPSSGDTAGDYVALFNGTSAATPHVAGLAALLFSQYPTLTNQQVRDIIERTCDKITPGLYSYAHAANRPNGTWHEEVGYGRINCNMALRYADIMIADHAGDTGAVPSTALVGGVWTPDIFWGHQPYVTTASNPGALPADHEPAQAGQDNYVHAVITNLGPASLSNIDVSWHIMDYPGTELIWPVDWNLGNRIATASIPVLAAGASTPVEAIWPQSLVGIASAYAHPCMVVHAGHAQDVGGDAGDYVYQYNNIAQHNISIAGFASGAQARERRFTLPFAVGHTMSTSREATLVFDLRKANGARVLLDLDPDASLPYIDRIQETMREFPPQGAGRSSCRVTATEDTTLLLECGGCRADVVLKRGSMLTLNACGSAGALQADALALEGASPETGEGGDKVLRLEGAHATVRMPLLEGQVVPLALTIEAPPDAPVGRRFRVDVTQLSVGQPTGGVSLDVEAKPRDS